MTTVFEPGTAVGGDQTYASVTPTILAVSSSEATLSWPAPVDTGKSPVTGYHVYMFDGIGLNSQADPQPVKHEIQVSVTMLSCAEPKYGLKQQLMGKAFRSPVTWPKFDGSGAQECNSSWPSR